MKIQNSLKHLFISQTRVKLINTLFYFPQEIYYVRQLVRITEEEINSVRRELDNLKKADIVKSEWRGNRLYYWANRGSSLFLDLLTLANKNAGLGLVLQNKTELSGKIKLLFYNYKLVSGENKEGAIDLVIVGNVLLKEVESAIKLEEEKRGREINYMIMDKGEFQLRKQKRDQFIVDFFLSSPLVIIGNPREIINI